MTERGADLAAEATADLARHASLATVPASDIRPSRVEWLWDGRVPFSTLTVLAGPPGQGKSTILCDLASRVSREGRVVLIATAEDHLAKVARPRLEAAGADLDLVRFITDLLDLPQDAERLAELVRSFETALVVVDPLVAFVHEAVNTHRDHHVRRVLAPLAAIAESTNAAVACVVHTNKAPGEDPLMRVSGSIGIVAAARLVLLAAADPDDADRHVLAVAKSNVGVMPPPLAYRIEGAVVAEDIGTSRIEWLGEVDVELGRLLAPASSEERGAHHDAAEFLRESGVTESAQPARTLLAEAKAGGIAERTLRRARRSLGISAWKDGLSGGWWWGPRLEGANHTPGPLAPSALPGETHSSSAEGANSQGLAGSGEPEPDWRRIQHEAGEEPEKDTAAALARLKAGLDATEAQDAI